MVTPTDRRPRPHMRGLVCLALALAPPWRACVWAQQANGSRVCPAGFYSGSSGSDLGACVLCEAGTYSQLTHADANCTACAPGKHQGNAGQSECADCGLGTYQDTAGKALCESCPPHSSTCYIGTDKKGKCKEGETSVAGCHCSAGYFKNRTADPHGNPYTCSVCPVGGSCCSCAAVSGCYGLQVQSGNHSSDTCDEDALFRSFERFGQACSDCFVGTESRPIAGPGYFARPDSNVMMRCEIHRANLGSAFSSEATASASVAISEEAMSYDIQSNCHGGPESTCKHGTTGLFCADCIDGWYKDDQARQCFECTRHKDAAKFLITLLFILGLAVGVPVVMAVLHLLAADMDSGQHLVYFRLLVDHLQLMSVNLNLMANWPLPMIQVMLVSSASTLDLSVLRMECAFGVDHVVLYLLKLGSPFGIVTALIVYDCFVYVLYQAAKRSSRKSTAREQEEAAEADAAQLNSLGTPLGTALAAAPLDSAAQPGCDGDEGAKEGTPEPEGGLEGRLEPEGGLELVLEEGAAKEGEPGPGTPLVPATPRPATFSYVVVARLKDWKKNSHALFKHIPAVPETEEEWKDFKYVQTQVILTILMWLYISVVDACVAVFDCTLLADGREYLLMHQSVQCSWDGWWMVLVCASIPSLVVFVFGLPALFIYIFLNNVENAQMGELTTLKKYGFLFKTYSRSGFFWELVVLVRKAVIVTISRVGHIDPFLQGVLSLVAYFGFLSFHANVQPYRLEKHNTMAMYLLSVNTGIVLSSLLFLSEQVSADTKTLVMSLNVTFILLGWLRCAFGLMLDLWVYMNLTFFLEKMEKLGFVDSVENIREQYKEVDKNGLIDKPLVDVLVTRNRFVHNVLRPQVDGTTGPEITHEEAKRSFNEFHDYLGSFIRRINKEASLDRGESSPRMAMFSNPMTDDEVGEGSEDGAHAELNSGVVREANLFRDMPRDLKHLEERAAMLKQMYTEKNLAYMVLFMEEACRYDWVDRANLRNAGPGQLMNELLQFDRQISDACAVNLAEPADTEVDDTPLAEWLGNLGISNAETRATALDEKCGITTVSQVLRANLDADHIRDILTGDIDDTLHTAIADEVHSHRQGPAHSDEGREVHRLKGRRMLLNPDTLLGLKLRQSGRGILTRLRRKMANKSEPGNRTKT